jgi:hypothetical protein
MHGGDVIVISAFDRCKECASGFCSALVFVLKADQSGQMGSDGYIAAINDLIAIGNNLRFVGGAIEHGLAGGRVAIGAGDGDDVA